MIDITIVHVPSVQVLGRVLAAVQCTEQSVKSLSAAVNFHCSMDKKDLKQRKEVTYIEQQWSNYRLIYGGP